MSIKASAILGAWIIAISLLAAGGCAKNGATYSLLKEPGGGGKAPAQVQVVMDGSEPGCKADPIGVVEGHSNSVWGSFGESIQALQGEAAKHGASGIMKVKCAAPGEVGGADHRCAATAYVCR